MFGRIIRLIRLENNIHPVLGIIAGYLFVGLVPAIDLVYAIVAFVMIHTIANIWNDIEDEDVDVLNGQKDVHRVRGERKVWVLWTIMAVSGAVTVFCLAHFPFIVGALLSSTVVCAWAYNSRPIQASRRPILSMVLLAIAYGVTPVLIGMSFGSIDYLGVLFIVSWTMARLSLSLLKDFKDAHGDAKVDKKTFLLVYGKNRTVQFSVVLASFGLLGVLSLVFVVTQNTLAMVLLAIATAMIFMRAHMFRMDSYDSLNKEFHQGLQYQAVFDGMVVACLSIWLGLV